MNHEQRIKLANEFKDKILKKYQDDILGVALFGSVARNEDKENSDLELLVVTKKFEKNILFNHKGIPIAIYFHTFDWCMNRISKPSSIWPLVVAKFIEVKPLYEKRSIFGKFRKAVDKIKPQELLDECAGIYTVSQEYYGKILNAFKEDNLVKIIFPSWQLFFNAMMIVGIVNKRYYFRQGVQMAEEAKEFAELPEQFYDLSMKIVISKEVKTIKTAADTLMTNLREYLAARNIKSLQYKDIRSYLE